MATSPALHEPRELGPAAPAPPRRPARWGDAWRALRELVRDPERTDRVFALIDCLGGDDGERQFRRFRADPAGRRLLLERPSLLANLRDRARLEALPDGSLGHCYADFMGKEELQADGLVQAAESARTPDRAELDSERRFFYDRLRDMHDLWHVLTGYGRDLAGEAAVLAFTYGQTPTRGIGAIVLAAMWLGPKRGGLAWQRYLVRAWRRGRRCRALMLAPFEELLPLPVSEVRARLGIEAPERAHPGGVVVFGEPAAS